MVTRGCVNPTLTVNGFSSTFKYKPTCIYSVKSLKAFGKWKFSAQWTPREHISRHPNFVTKWRLKVKQVEHDPTTVTDPRWEVSRQLPIVTWRQGGTRSSGESGSRRGVGQVIVQVAPRWFPGESDCDTWHEWMHNKG